MRRVGLCLCAAVFGALLAAASIESAQSRAPRFLVTITGTQHFEWTLQDSAGLCSYKGHGEQSETFGTSRPVKVIAPPPRGGSSREFQALSQGAWGRVVPLTGRETRAYQALLPPIGECRNVRPELRSNCSGTNALLPRAGVALMRDYRKVALHVPVTTPWIERRPSICDIRLFDLRNFFLSAVFGLGTYKPVLGGTFENRRAKTLRVAFSARYCVDPAESSDFEIFLKTTCRPPSPGRRGPILTGRLRTDWTATFRRTR